MKQISRLLMLLMLIAMTACGGDESASNDADTVIAADEPTMEPTREPTRKPTEVPSNTPVPEPTDVLTATPVPEPTALPMPEIEGVAQAFDALGLTVFVPEGYEAETFGPSVALSASFTDDAGILASVVPPEQAATVDEAFEQFVEAVIGDGRLVGERRAIVIDGYDGYEADYSVDDDGAAYAGMLIVVGNGERIVVMTSAAPEALWEARVSAEMQTFVAELEIYPPVAAETETEALAATTDDSGQQGTDTSGLSEGKPDGTTTIATIGTGAAGVGSLSDELGLACLGTQGEGMTCLSADGEWQSYTRETSQLGGDFISAIVPCFDDTLLITHSSGLSQFDGKTFRNIDAGWGFSSADDVACASDGTIWVAHFEGVSRFDDGTWTTFDSDTYFDGETLVYAVDIAADGTVWVATSNNIGRFAGGEWDLYVEEDFGDLFFFEDIELDANGVLWAVAGDGMVSFDGTAWTKWESPNYMSPESVVIDAEGKKWISTFRDGLELFDGVAWQTLDRSTGDLGSNRTAALAIDGAGRLWVGTAFGVQILTGDEWVTYRMDNAGLIDNDIASIGIIAGGPTLPELLEKARGSVTGIIVKDDAPIANASIEICVETLYSSFDGETPCDGQPVFFQAETDADGRFLFDDVPLGRYAITIETDSGWAKMSTYGLSSDLFLIGESELVELGELIIEGDG